MSSSNFFIQSEMCKMRFLKSRSDQKQNTIIFLQTMNKILINNSIYFKNKKLLKGVIFVIDSSTFTKKIKDVAEFLYDVLFECRDKIPIIVACNKQDASYSKASKVRFLYHI